jgi:hypothetical protein
MPVAWIASPLTPCALVAAGLGLALYLFCTLKIEIRAGGRRRRGPPPAPPEMAELRRRLDEMEARWRESESRAAPAEPPAVRPGMNLNRRSQALRLYRRGETPGEIARLLAMPGGEVRLLLKVHRLLAEEAVEGPAREKRLNPGPESADKAHSGVKPSRRSWEPT